MRRTTAALVVSSLAVSGMLAPTVRAQYTAIDLHPVGVAGSSKALDLRLGQQVGFVNSVAARWTGTAASYISINPGANSIAYGTDGVQHVGFSGGVPNPGIFGSAVTYSGATPGIQYDLTPAPPPTPYNGSVAMAVFAGEQVGIVYDDPNNIVGGRAAMWYDSGSPIYNLQPAGAFGSIAYSTHFGQQAGSVVMPFNSSSRVEASVWYGSAASRVSLHPAGAIQSEALDTHFSNSQSTQVGYVQTVTGRRAALWNSTAASWVDLHPNSPTISESVAVGVFNNLRVGYVIRNGANRATLWTGSSNVSFDLHQFLPSGVWAGSSAEDVWIDNAGYIHIAGWVTDGGSITHAYLWTTAPVPEPTSLAAIGVASAALLGRRRRKALRH
jgi:hypothetical protein